jgi:hypothetical protein
VLWNTFYKDKPTKAGNLDVDVAILIVDMSNLDANLGGYFRLLFMVS